ncbi:MAG: amino acid adenylation domain-containing protein [Vicinamibacterales bacterium]
MTPRVSSESLANPANETAGVGGDEFVLPASPAQQRLWYIDSLRPGHPVYNIPAAFDLDGPLDVPALQRSLDGLVARHESLRTSFAETGDGLRQVVADAASVPIAIVECGGVPSPARASQRDRRLAELARRPFELTRGPLLSATLLRWSPTAHTLLLLVHHIVADGWSIAVIGRELSCLYGAHAAGEVPTLAPVELQYADYSVWQQRRLDAGEFAPQLEFWQRHLLGAPPALELPTDHPRPAAKTYDGGVEWLDLPPERAAAIREVARQLHVTPFVVLLAGCSFVLGRYAGTTDVVLGTPIADRFRPETEAMVGFLVNTVVLRCDLAQPLTVRELLTRLHERVAMAIAHHELPFDRLVDALRPVRHLGRTPVVEVMIALQPDPLEAFAFAGLTTVPVPIHNGTAKFDLHFGFEEAGTGLRCMLEYSTDLFTAQTIRRLSRHLDAVLAAIVAAPDRRIDDLTVLTPEEEQRALVEWNRTARDYPSDRSVSRLVEARAAASAGAIAVRAGAAAITYGELNRRANRLAAVLAASGAGPGDHIALALERSIDLIVAMLAVVKLRAVYVPLDPANPPARLQTIVDDAGVAVVIVHAATATLALAGPRRVDLEALPAAIEAGGDPVEACGGSDVAYVMYTSGSTGRPKGVAVPHRGIARLVVGTDYVTIGPGDVVAQVSNQAFDAATFEIWGALANGATLDIVDRDTVLSPHRFARCIRDHRVSTMFLTSALFNAVAAHEPAAFATMTQLVVGGDVVEPRWAAAVLRAGPPARLINGYGPTEATTFAAWHVIDDASAAGPSIPIGRPIANTTLYVLDERMRVVPVGVTGELYIGGPGVACGYLGDEQLTARRFVAAPFAGGGRLYRTGDAARYRPDGTIEFRGRLDGQVKVRGFRVEPGEVEAIIARHPQVADVVVTARTDSGGERRLVACVVGIEPVAEALAPAVREWLTTQVPDYMLPVVITLPALPLTANGKIDREALPDVEAVPASPSWPPATATERALARIWAEVLNRDELGTDQTFFDLGGHSLSALRVFARIQEQFSVTLTLATLFDAPTIGRLSAVIDAARAPAAGGGAATPAALSPSDGGDRAAGGAAMLPADVFRRSPCLVAIRPTGTRRPFFVLPGAGGNILGFQPVARHLNPDQPVVGLESLGRDGRHPPMTSFEAIAARFIGEMRTLQPQGPYAIGGISFGGMVAFEMAQQLRASGERVSLLALLDTGFDGGRNDGSAASVSWRTALLEVGGRMRRAGLALIGGAEGSRSSYLWTRVRRVRSRLARRRWRRRNEIAKIAARIEAGDHLPLPEILRHVRQANLLAYHRYRPARYDGDVTLFFATERPQGDDTTARWRELAGSLIVHPVPGSHQTMLEEPNVRVLARELDAALAKTDGQAMPWR